MWIANKNELDKLGFEQKGNMFVKKILVRQGWFIDEYINIWFDRYDWEIEIRGSWWEKINVNSKHDLESIIRAFTPNK